MTFRCSKRKSKCSQSNKSLITAFNESFKLSLSVTVSFIAISCNLALCMPLSSSPMLTILSVSQITFLCVYITSCSCSYKFLTSAILQNNLSLTIPNKQCKIGLPITAERKWSFDQTFDYACSHSIRSSVVGPIHLKRAHKDSN